MWLDLWGLSVRAPITVATNLALAVQCALYARGLRGADAERTVWWRRFFAAMAFATGAGVLKHGFPHVLSSMWYDAVLWVLGATGGAAVFCAQRATVATRASARARPWLERAAMAGAALFSIACIVNGPLISLLIAYNAVGLLPVLGAEIRTVWTTRGSWTGVAGGLLVSVLAGLVNALRVSPGLSLTHVDVAHVLMGLGFFLIHVEVAAARLAPPDGGLGSRRLPAKVRA
jgi:hypothetical protein